MVNNENGYIKSDQELADAIHAIVIPTAIEENIELTDKGLLYVAQAIKDDFQFKSFRAKLQKLSLLKQTRVVTGAQLSQIKNNKLKSRKQNDSVAIAKTTVSDAVNLFDMACKLKASDIHLRLHKTMNTAETLFRINGSLQPITEYRYEYARSLCQTIYGTMCDVSDSTYMETEYQDARIANPANLPKGVRSIRVATGPKDDGQWMVLRMLYEDEVDTSFMSKKQYSGSERLAWLGYSSVQSSAIEMMKRIPSGMNIIAGPTGSGKTTTLKHILESIASSRPDLNILTVEDPPEYPIKGSQQLPVTINKAVQAHNGDEDAMRNKAFGNAIRAAMRADPNIIMLGEIRDWSSARLALRAAMTGHPVWTTIHANSAFNVINRLSDLLSEAPNASTDPIRTLSDRTIMTGLIYQQLVKRLCPDCCKPLLKYRDELETSFMDRLIQVVDLKKDKVMLRGDGCQRCGFTGWSGRTVVAEVVPLDPHLLRILREEGVDAAAQKWMQSADAVTHTQHAIDKIKEGTVDPRQAEEVIGPLTRDLALKDGSLSNREIKEMAGAGDDIEMEPWEAHEESN